MLVLGSAAVVAALLSAAMTMLGNDDDPEPLRTRIPPPEFTVSPPAQNDSTLRSVRPSDADPVTFGFAVDATINLEVRGSTDVRLRHQDFLAETAPLSARSSDAERADFRFRVRRGLSRPSCVSLEAFSYEGLYLRQTTFVLGIGPRDGTYSDEDATLCPVRVDGGGFVLGVASYPNHYLVVRDGGVHLDRVPPAAATPFTVVPAR